MALRTHYLSVSRVSKKLTGKGFLPNDRRPSDSHRELRPGEAEPFIYSANTVSQRFLAWLGHSQKNNKQDGRNIQQKDESPTQYPF